MIIKGKVLSVSQDKKGITTLMIVTSEIWDHIIWVGEEVKVAKPEYELKEVDEQINWTGYEDN